jgi:MFS family permease
VPTVALIASGMAMLAMTRFGPGVPLLAAMTVAFSAGPALTPLANTAMGEISPAGKRSGVLATAHAVASLGGVIAPFVSGLIAQTAGFDAALDLAAGLLLVGALLAALGIRPERDVIGYGPQLPVE